MSQPSLLIPIKKADQYSSTLVGEIGKTKSKLLQAKLPISDGFVISSQIFHELLTSKIAIQLESMLALIDIHDPNSVKEAGTQIRRLIQRIPFTEELAKEVAEYTHQFGKQSFCKIQGYFAHQTHPTVSPDYSQGETNILIDIKKMWASLFQDSVLINAVQHQHSLNQLKPVILVEASTQPKVAGRMSTINPHNGNKRTLLIEAVWGLPEYLSTHPGEKDEYELEKDSWEILNTHTQVQEKEIVFSAGKTTLEKVPASRKKLQKLSENQLLLLAHLVKKIQATFFFPQECFWQIDTQNQLTLTAIQPLTESHLSQSFGSQFSRPLAYGTGAYPGKASGKARVLKQWSAKEKIDPTDILVIKNLKPSDIVHLPPVAGLVCDNALLPKDLTRLHIPAIINTKIASSVIHNEQLITVVADFGIVVDGVTNLTATHQQTNKQPSKATEWWYQLEHLNHVSPDLVQRSNGIGPVRGKDVLQLFGIHPQVFTQRHKLGVFEEALYQTLQTLLVVSDKKPVIYELLDMTSDEYRQLTGGDNVETVETNALLGYHGAYRMIFEREILHVQLRVIDRLRQQFDHLQILIPFVRTIEEWVVLMKAIHLLEYCPPVWVGINTPSIAFSLHQLVYHEAKGIVIHEKDLFSLFTGSQIDQPHDFLPKIQENDGYFSLITMMAETTKALKIPMIYDLQIGELALVSQLKKHGVKSFTFTESQKSLILDTRYS